jgi:hypothetical protein
VIATALILYVERLSFGPGVDGTGIGTEVVESVRGDVQRLDAPEQNIDDRPDEHHSYRQYRQHDEPRMLVPECPQPSRQ